MKLFRSFKTRVVREHFLRFIGVSSVSLIKFSISTESFQTVILHYCCCFERRYPASVVLDEAASIVKHSKVLPKCLKSDTAAWSSPQTHYWSLHGSLDGASVILLSSRPVAETANERMITGKATTVKLRNEIRRKHVFCSPIDNTVVEYIGLRCMPLYSNHCTLVFDTRCFRVIVLQLTSEERLLACAFEHLYIC